MLRKLIAVGALVLATMCLAVPASYADVSFETVTINQVGPADFVLDITAPAEFAVVDMAAMPSPGDDDEPIADFCSLEQRLSSDPIGRLILHLDDPGWCAG